MLQHILDSNDLTRGRLIKQRGKVEKLYKEDAGTLVLGYWLRSIIYKPIVVPYYPVHSVSAFTNRRFLFLINKMLKYFCNNCRRIITSEGTNWAIEQLGVHLMFPLDAVSEPTPIMVQRLQYSVCSPPLQEHEAITSNVIELSPMDTQGVKFNTKARLSLSHSATNLRGYELVIKKLTDKEMNKWKDLDGTKDIRSLEGT